MLVNLLMIAFATKTFGFSVSEPNISNCDDSLMLPGLSLHAKDLVIYGGVTESVACCDLCKLHVSCVAYTIEDNCCKLKDWMVPFQRVDHSVMSGIMRRFYTVGAHGFPIEITPMDNVVIQGSVPLATYDTANKSFCTILCDKYEESPEPGSGGAGEDSSGPVLSVCTAFVIDEGRCTLHNNLATSVYKAGAVGGTMRNAHTHYANPVAAGCLIDEMKLRSPFAPYGFFCAPAFACQTRGNWCPPDTPLGVTAMPSCSYMDPFGDKHCVLLCSEDSACGPTGKCSTEGAHGLCQWVPPPGERETDGVLVE